MLAETLNRLMEAESPRVCIVVPILNEARYLRGALDSLLSQDYRPLDIVVYDGGSTDGSLGILQNYPFQVIVERGLGQMAAINRAWRTTSADFVGWMAGDDLLRPGAIGQLARALAANPGLSFVHADADIIDAEGKTVAHLRRGEVQLRDILCEFTIIPQTTLIRRISLEKSGMMDEAMRLAADWDLFLRLLQYYPCAHVPATVAARRVHDQSEDALNPAAAALAIVKSLDRFLSRPDLTPQQRLLGCRGIAGSRIAAAGNLALAGQRKEAWRLALQALKACPSVFLTTCNGRHLLVYLLFPIPISYKVWHRVKARAARVAWGLRA